METRTAAAPVPEIVEGAKWTWGRQCFHSFEPSPTAFVSRPRRAPRLDTDQNTPSRQHKRPGNSDLSSRPRPSSPDSPGRNTALDTLDPAWTGRFHRQGTGSWRADRRPSKISTIGSRSARCFLEISAENDTGRLIPTARNPNRTPETLRHAKNGSNGCNQ